MGGYAQETLRRLLAKCSSAATLAARGSTLEDLAQYVFEQVPSVTLYARDVKDEVGAQEVDLIFSHLFFTSRIPIPDLDIIVECKNERRKTSSPQVTAFANKLRSRGLNVGILVTAAGLSGSRGMAGHAAIRDELRGGVAIIIVTAAELGGLDTPDDFVQLLANRLNELRTYRGYHTI